MSPPHAGHASGNSSPTRAISFAQAFARRVMRAALLGRVSRVATASCGVTVTPMPAGCGVGSLADVADRQRRDRPPESLIRCKHPWLVSAQQAMPVLARRRHKIREPVEKLKRRELDHAVGPGRMLLALTPIPDAVVRFGASGTGHRSCFHGRAWRRRGRALRPH